MVVTTFAEMTLPPRASRPKDVTILTRPLLTAAQGEGPPPTDEETHLGNSHGQ